MSTYRANKSPHVTYIPTLTGGIGAEELRRFYSELFISCNPATTKLTLLSRTIGADRVVDELHVAFKHTQEMPWILPGLPPTNKKVEILVVSIVTLRGGSLHYEHVYWDQASVLVQVGLLDPKVVPQKASERGVKRLPVVGKEAAERVLWGYDFDDEGEATNDLIPGWYEDENDDVVSDNDSKDTNVNGNANGNGETKTEQAEQGGELKDKEPEQVPSEAQEDKTKGE